jgi:subtilisin
VVALLTWTQDRSVPRRAAPSIADNGEITMQNRRSMGEAAGARSSLIDRMWRVVPSLTLIDAARRPVRQRASLFISVLIVLGLTLSGVPAGSPIAPGTSQARGAAPESAALDTEPELAGKRAKRGKHKDHKNERKQNRPQDGHKKRDGKAGKKDNKKGHPKSGKRERRPADAQGNGNQNQNQNQNKDKNPKQNESKSSNPSPESAQDSARDPQRGRELTTGRLPAAEAVATAAHGKLSAEDRYIVLLAESAGNVMSATTDIAAALPGVVPTHVYRNVFPGFAAVIPDDQLDAVRNDPRVAAIAPDDVVYAQAQTLPAGINRIDADLNPTAKIDGIDERVNIDVAVVDTAGNDFHEDLNIWAWANCTDSPVNTDDDGHGTHVGGTIGALDNGIGVVGVAPGARLWNFRVLVNGRGLNSWIVCGLDTVTQYATDQGDGLGDIEVANVSISGNGADGNCQDDPYHLAYCRAVAAGVTVVVAAGNDARDAVNTVPATYAEVITVSALADSDGRPGGVGPATSAGPDDSFATFSNFGGEINIAAPGVDILSTVPGGYGVKSGTSMASPHVAGAAALYLINNPGAAPAQVKAEIVNNREQTALPNDPDGMAEGVIKVAAGGGPPPPPPPPPPAPPPPPTGAPPPPAVESPPPTVDSGEQSPDKKNKKGGRLKGKKGKKGKGKKKH